MGDETTFLLRTEVLGELAKRQQELDARAAELEAQQAALQQQAEAQAAAVAPEFASSIELATSEVRKAD